MDFYSATMTDNPMTVMSKASDTAQQLHNFVDANTVATYSPLTDVSVAFDGNGVGGYLFSSFSDQVGAVAVTVTVTTVSRWRCLAPSL